MQQQKSLADLKKKNAQLRKKDRRKKRAFRQKTQPIMDVATSFANHQVVQTQVKQNSKTAGEVFSAVHDQTAKRQANDSVEDKKNAELKMVQKQGETALLHNEQMALYHDRGVQQRAVTTEAVINGAAGVFKKLEKGFETLSEAKQKALKTFTEDYINDQRMLMAAAERLAAAEKAGDLETAAAERNKIQELEKNVKDKFDEAERNIGEGLKDVFQNLKEQRAALKNLSDAIANLDVLMGKGFEMIMGALKNALGAAFKAQPCLAKEKQIPIYWCINQVNYCRHTIDPTPAQWPDLRKGITLKPCYQIQLTDVTTGVNFQGPAAYFCHEGKDNKDFGEQINKSEGFSEIWSVPTSVIKRMMSDGSKAKELGVGLSGWSENDLQNKHFPFKNAIAYNRNKIKNALKVFFPNNTPEAEKIRRGADGANAYNKLLYTSIQEALEYVIQHGCS